MTKDDEILLLKLFNGMTEKEAFEWLIENDPEGADFWKDIADKNGFDGTLFKKEVCVNLNDFGTEGLIAKKEKLEQARDLLLPENGKPADDDISKAANLIMDLIDSCQNIKERKVK